ncbi:uncharacterized protein LOC144143484 [Haemaphysalis longicornis]
MAATRPDFRRSNRVLHSDEAKRNVYTVFGFGEALDWKPTAFVGPIPPSMLCISCGRVAMCRWRLPCQHVVCPLCYDGKSYCPVDEGTFPGGGAEMTTIRREHCMHRKIYCWNAKQGCEAVGDVFFMIRHYNNECPFSPAPLRSRGRNADDMGFQSGKAPKLTTPKGNARNSTRTLLENRDPARPEAEKRTGQVTHLQSVTRSENLVHSGAVTSPTALVDTKGSTRPGVALRTGGSTRPTALTDKQARSHSGDVACPETPSQLQIVNRSGVTTPPRAITSRPAIQPKSLTPTSTRTRSDVITRPVARTSFQAKAHPGVPAKENAKALTKPEAKARPEAMTPSGIGRHHKAVTRSLARTRPKALTNPGSEINRTDAVSPRPSPRPKGLTPSEDVSHNGRTTRIRPTKGP